MLALAGKTVLARLHVPGAAGEDAAPVPEVRAPTGHVKTPPPRGGVFLPSVCPLFWALSARLSASMGGIRSDSEDPHPWVPGPGRSSPRIGLPPFHGAGMLALSIRISRAKDALLPNSFYCNALRSEAFVSGLTRLRASAAPPVAGPLHLVAMTAVRIVGRRKRGVEIPSPGGGFYSDPSLPVSPQEPLRAGTRSGSR